LKSHIALPSKESSHSVVKKENKSVIVDEGFIFKK